MKRLIIGLLLVMLLLVPVACAKAPEEAVVAPMPALPPMPPGLPAREEVFMPTGADTLPSTAEERMIVRNGDYVAGSRRCS